MSKPLSASTEFGQMTVIDKRKSQIVAGQHLGMTSEEGQARLDGNEKNYTRVVQKENDTQRPLSQEQDNRILEDAILTNCLQQQKETKINLKKMNSEPTIEEKDPVPDEAVGMDEVQPFRPDSSSWNATSLTFNHGTSQRSGDSKFGDKRPFATHSRSKPLSASTEFGQMTVIDKRKTQIGVDECSKCDPASSLSRKTGNKDSWPISEEWLFDVNTKKEATKPAIGKRENRVAIIESAPQDQTSNDNLTCVDSAHQDNIRVKKSSLGLGQDEDEESPWDSETSIEVEDPVPEEAVGKYGAQPCRPDSSSWNATSLTFNHGTSQRSGDSKFGDKRPFATHSRSKPLSASTEFGQMTVIDKRKTQIGVDECSKCDPASSLSRETGNKDSWPISEEWLFDVNTKKEATKPQLEKEKIVWLLLKVLHKTKQAMII
ncbi:uncharacterized protein LOC141570137 isoform X2 [Rhinolophus sinicus]|uniref:uncharacterized protein LOC141570137 isoform X2 n=1 Tax=Rhinolophus sinicus TaxID=89399 RepID=UPI003D78BABE